MVHQHDPKSSQVHAPHDVQRGSLKTVLFFSLTYMVAELVGGILSGSLSLIADAGHMLIDSLAILIGLVAVWLTNRPASLKRTYGYHRAEILAALLNGSLLILISFWIFYEAWDRFRNPNPINAVAMLGVAIGGLFVNLFSLLVLKKHSHEGVNMRGVWLHVLSDTLGSVSAIIAAVLVMFFGWTQADAVTSSIIAFLILRGAWVLVVECVDVLLESTPRGLDIADIRNSLCAVNGIDDVHDLHVWTVKSGTFSFSAHVRVKEGFEQAGLLTELTALMENKFGICHTTIQLETVGFKHEGDEFKECNLGRV